ncbi:MAG TPA: hypothetical protein VJ978_01130 [Nitriliruptoraceae bacterium]|nr:hypothetical protein [Nitriliruptoraceae bacterium]
MHHVPGPHGGSARRLGFAAAMAVTVAVTLAACGFTTDTGTASGTNAATDGPATPEGPATPAPASTSDDPSSTPGTGVVVITHEGGCMMMGPNCLEWAVATDGAWTATRVGEQEEVASGQVPPALVTDVVAAAEAAQADGSLADVGPGVCNACADGIDLAVQVTTPAGQLALDSVDQDFGADIAVFDAIAALESELVASTDVEPVSR